MPPSIIPKGMATPDLIASIAGDKFWRPSALLSTRATALANGHIHQPKRYGELDHHSGENVHGRCSIS
jgi:hypothetical protein